MKGYKIKAFLLSMLITGSVITTTTATDKTEKEIDQLLVELNEVYESAFMEAHGLNSAKKVFVFDLNGEILVDALESELSIDQYKLIFQSDLVLESTGNTYYINTINDTAFNQSGKIN